MCVNVLDRVNKEINEWIEGKIGKMKWFLMFKFRIIMRNMFSKDIIGEWVDGREIWFGIYIIFLSVG